MGRLRSSIRAKCREFYWTASRALGFGHIHGVELHHLRRSRRVRWVRRCLSALLRPALWPVAKLLQRRNVAFIKPEHPRSEILIGHVGHLAIDFDSIFKELLLDGRELTVVYVMPGCRPANEALFRLWAARMVVVRSLLLRLVVGEFLFSFPELLLPIDHYCFVMDGASRSHLVQARWGDRPPLASLDAGLKARGREVLRSWGLPDDAWFVCVHSREGGYAPKLEAVTNYRNSDIASYVAAMELINRRGGWCIRVGDASMKPLPPMPRTVDYALSADKSDWMDLFLCAECRFFLGNTSGLFGVAGIFGRPSALANITPFSSLYSQFPRDISIPKLLRTVDGDTLPVAEVFASDASHYRLAPQFTAAGLRHVDNTPAEIAALAEEMLATLDAGAVPAEHPLQAQVRSMLRPDHYCWHSAAQVGLSFLEAHEAPLPHEDVEDAVSAVAGARGRSRPAPCLAPAALTQTRGAS